MIPDRLCNGGRWRSCAECWRNIDNHEEIDPKRTELPISPDSCGGSGYYTPPVEPLVPESRL